MTWSRGIWNQSATIFYILIVNRVKNLAPVFQNFWKEPCYLILSENVFLFNIWHYIKLLLSFISALYAVFLYRYIKEWRKNPHWSFSCCLALLLPLNELQGELRGLAGANVLKNQLQTGQIEKPSLLSAMKDSGAIDVTLEEGEQGDGNKVEMQDENQQNTLHRHPRRHQGIQTKISTVPIAVLVRGPKRDSNGEWMWVVTSGSPGRLCVRQYFNQLVSSMDFNEGLIEHKFLSN